MDFVTRPCQLPSQMGPQCALIQIPPQHLISVLFTYLNYIPFITGIYLVVTIQFSF